MQRRSFLLGAGAVAALGSVAGYWRWQEITPSIHMPGMQQGHFLRDLARDRRALPPPSYAIDTDVVILGSGIAGLTTAWKLRKEGHSDFVMVDGPQPYGNAAGGSHGDLAYPTGAHYLPLPTRDAFHVREMLHDLGILLRNPSAERPYYDERFILHAPQDRILFDGSWQEGLIPKDGVPQWELDEHERFFQAMAHLKATRGADGKPLFVLPSALSSSDPAWQALDRISFRQWLEQAGYKSPTLHWYLDYTCRDDYGTGYEQTSAWAGLHYSCSRDGLAENAATGEWLTWPGGLQPIASALSDKAGKQRKDASVATLKPNGKRVEVLCVEFVNGQPRSFLVHARKAVCAMPLFVAAGIVDAIRDYGFDPAAHMPAYAPWMVTNFLMRSFPREKAEAPLSWDNVVYQGKGLGYVVSTHQDIRVTPPEKTVFSAYMALSRHTPDDGRKWLDTASPDELLALAASDLEAAYGAEFGRYVEHADITLRPHAMCSPRPGFRSNAGLRALRETDGSVLFAHSDLSGFSVFEEAAWWGYRAALKLLG
ncbi:NAD(P)/FAD-dependent oxidoreductase [Noviherbaspirillum saxi]|uniref:NAD(P)/FAD-dependent oxidoreductase n=1 Tax=Noviherbaspirillum saxi TaxID=2320863 RepID=A0A3A3FPD0_9BURK|nr:NAD(P)/FAD-dependent oxidoreductase [Noviherbaspirillum saxi]RJF97320.1 NAD(P)/FAD-dependent oxidoreductase [Noviherbaspirillum saxi]